jgi:DNA polymerase III sliding clamp (beta) subunit (PCNA family)
MQIVLSRTELLSVLKRAGAACNPSDMLMMRQSVLIVAEEKTITFGATDGPLAVVCRALGGEIKETGRTVLNHKRLSAIASELPEGHVEITTVGFKVSIRSSSSKRKFSMTSLDSKDFPAVLDERPGIPMYTVEAKILNQAINEVSFAIERSAVDGALLAPSEDRKSFQLVTLSGRASAIATGWFTEPGEVTDCLLPSNLMDALGALKGDGLKLTFSMDDKKIFVESGDTIVMAARLQSAFPSVWKNALAGQPVEHRFRVSSDRFLESVHAVSVAADMVEGSERFIQIDVKFAEGGCTISTRKSEKSHGEDELVVLDPSAGEFSLSMDAQVLSAALRSFSPAELDLFCDGPTPGLIMLKNDSLIVLAVPLTQIPDKPKEKK